MMKLPLTEASTIQVIPRTIMQSGYNNVSQAKQASTSSLQRWCCELIHKGLFPQVICQMFLGSKLEYQTYRLGN